MSLYWYFQFKFKNVVFLHYFFDFMLRMLFPNIIYIIIYLPYPIIYIIVSKHQYNFIMKISLLVVV